MDKIKQDLQRRRTPGKKRKLNSWRREHQWLWPDIHSSWPHDRININLTKTKFVNSVWLELWKKNEVSM